MFEKLNRKKVCWNITTKCNQNCGYCYRFLKYPELSYEDNETILRNLIRDGITEITWTGGEALLYPNLEGLIKISKENGIKNKLITNGEILLKDKNTQNNIIELLDFLTLSIDSINVDTNIKLGRGINHYNNVKNILDYTKNTDLKININTVVSQKNIEEIETLGTFLNNYKINQWKLYKFIPFREKAKENKNQFEITNEEFFKNKNAFKFFENIKNIDYRTQTELERDSLLIIANGDIIRTENGVDIKKGNALYNNVVEIIDKENNYTDYKGIRFDMRKIKILIAHDNENIINQIINSTEKLDYIEIVGIAKEGEETFNKIVNLKPEMVFTKFDLNKMNGLEIIKKSKEKLKGNLPVFNIISDRNLDSELKEMIQEIGSNFNALIGEEENLDLRLNSIFKDYKEFKNIL